MDSEQFKMAAGQLVDFIGQYLDNIRSRPVLPSVDPFYMVNLVPDHAPEEPETWDAVFKDIERVIMPGMTHWHSPQFHAYFPTANSYPAICADMLSSALACIGFTWIASPACTELEMIMMDWLAKMLGLPEEFLFSSPGTGGGVIQGTASEATLVTMLAAKDKMLKGLKENNMAAGVEQKLVCYASNQSHSSVERAALLAGVTIHLLQPDEHLSVRGHTLSAAIEADRAEGLVPFFVVGTMGTTSTCSFDNIEELGVVCTEKSVWLHVDAAYAGAALVCPEFRHLAAGVHRADSFNTNPHKWLLVNFDCSTLWLKDPSHVVNAFNVNPVYLRHEVQGQIPDYRHWQIPLGRRFRSLKMWFVFRLYGVKGLQEHIRKQIALARKFEDLLKMDARFEVVHSCPMALVCFHLRGRSDDVTESVVKTLNDRKKIHLTPTVVNGKYLIRFAICASSTEEQDIELAYKEICHVVDTLPQ
ncbi:Aromatic-L-amino-acid decarboxylase [Halotydeus destructor]|nr:Aromatic-L-amino-acid decarboxylase [Halotydeus destructor]